MDSDDLVCLHAQEIDQVHAVVPQAIAVETERRLDFAEPSRAGRSKPAERSVAGKRQETHDTWTLDLEPVG